MHSQTFYSIMKEDWVILRGQHFVEASCYCAAKLPPWCSSFFLLHAFSHSILWGHIASSAPYILLTGPIRRCNSCGGSRHITGVLLSWSSHAIGGCITFPNFFASSFSLQDLKKFQNIFIKLAMLRWVPPVLRLSFVVSHHAQGARAVAHHSK